jgi:two-component system sensor histidine kinase KdpD
MLKISKLLIFRQYIISISVVVLTSLLCSFFTEIIGYRFVALILMLAVSVLAMLFEMLPVLLASVLSALIWNFFFISPKYTFEIKASEDLVLFLMYFIITVVNSLLSTKIKQFEKTARAKEEKEATIRLYNTLFNSLSHELRTPIATIIGSVDTLSENDGNIKEETQKELFKEIEKAAFRLNQQVENLLNMSRLETGTLSLRPDWCDINELIYNLLDSCREELSEHPVFFETKDMPLFKLDAGLLDQALQNILLNAAQYCPPGSPIYINIEKENNICCIIIEDNGPGFETDDLGKAFDKFFRPGKSKPGGLGLGLSIAKGFIEAHGGTIELKNGEKGGAKFIVKVPAEKIYIKDLQNE